MTNSNRLGKLDARDLAELRAIILTVIDDGCNCDTGEKHPWEFNEDGDDGPDAFTEDMANEQRLRFWAEYERRIIAKAKA